MDIGLKVGTGVKTTDITQLTEGRDIISCSCCKRERSEQFECNWVGGGRLWFNPLVRIAIQLNRKGWQ
jgi:hypothetical protein